MLHRLTNDEQEEDTKDDAHSNDNEHEILERTQFLGIEKSTQVVAWYKHFTKPIEYTQLVSLGVYEYGLVTLVQWLQNNS